MLETQPVTGRRSEIDFWLRWVLASSLGAAVGFVCGVICAYIASVPLAFLLGAILAPLGSRVGTLIFALLFVVGPAFGGMLIGMVVGAAQADRLPWSEDARARWKLRTAVSWAIGSGFGFPLAIAVSTGLTQYVDIIALGFGVPLMQLTAALIGLALGAGLRSALPPPAPPLSLWLAGQVAATSLGWVIAGLFDTGPLSVGLSWTGLVLGPLVYAMISGVLMVWVERRRLTSTGQA